MVLRLLLSLFALINIILIITLVYGIKSAIGDIFEKVGGVAPGYWDISNFVFTGTKFAVPNVAPSAWGSDIIDKIRSALDESSPMVSGVRGIVWFVLIQGIGQLIMAIALGFTGNNSVNTPQSGGRRR